MKVGYFVETPVEHNLTGGVRSFLNLVDELSKKGIEPYVVVSEEWALTEELKKLGIPFITSKMYRPFVGVVDKARFYHTKYYVKLIFNNIARIKATKWFRENGVELVHINSQFAGIVGAQVAQRLNIPYVYHIREYLDQDFGVTFYSPKLVEKYIKPANQVIAISKAIQAFYQEKLGRRLSLVYNGFPVGIQTYYETEKRFQKDKIHLVIVGRVNEAKGQQEALKALNVVVNDFGKKDLVLHIVGYMGKDPYEIELATYAEEHNLKENVVFHGFTNNPFEISKQYDVGLMCSVAEAFGRVTVEYMLASLLVIGANTGGTPEIIEDNKSGLLYEQGNPQDLARKIMWVLDHQEEANAMMNCGRERVRKEFSIQATSDNVINIYHELTK